MSSVGLVPGAGLGPRSLGPTSVPQAASFGSGTRPDPRERKSAPTSAVAAPAIPQSETLSVTDHITRLRDTLRAIADNFAPGAKLVIRPSEGAGQYIYEFIDPSSGAIIRQFPQQDLYKILLDQKLNPAPGSFLDAQI
jgi:hypothetical protein